MASKLGLVVTVATRHVTQHGIMTNGITSFKIEFSNLGGFGTIHKKLSYSVQPNGLRDQHDGV